MRKDSKEFIISLLDSQEGLFPLATEFEPLYSRDKSIKACLFDIYGTILISSSGDINTLYIRTKDLKKAFDATGIVINKSFKNEHAILFLILDIFRKVIINSHAYDKDNNIPFPEIEIREVWKEVIETAQKKEYIFIEDNFDITALTMVFELMNNKVYPMPGMNEVIEKIKKRNMPLGIVSNAQYYTPVIMNYFFTGQLYDKEIIVNFNNDLQFYSYKYKIAKPDTFLYDQAVSVLKEKYDIEACETLFVGNDMLKDILPAKQVGFKTVLFAGDKRSLRLRSDEIKIKGLKPDHVIVDLNQIFEII